MRSLLVLSLAATIATASLTQHGQSDLDFASHFAEFRAKYTKSYKDDAEEAYRFRVFAANMRRAADAQRRNPLAKFGPTEFSDMTPEEFKRTHHNAEGHFKSLKNVGLEKKVMSPEARMRATGQSKNWCDEGACSEVKNQGNCGSCFAFAATGNVEGLWKIAGNDLVSLSEQEIVSCDTIDSGCNGGMPGNAMKWLLKDNNGTLVTEESYPYVSANGNVPKCDLGASKKFGAQIDGWKAIDSNEDDMAAFIFNNGPLAGGVFCDSWMNYQGGIMTDCNNHQPDHGILIVGFDDTNKPPYWIVKNCWGPKWGEKGFIRLAKGSDQCGITSGPVTAEVKSAGPAPTTDAPQPPTSAPDSPPSPPSPPSGSGNFTQSICTDRQCTNCTAQSFPQRTCLNIGGAHVLAVCAGNGLIITSYGTPDCSGENTSQVNAVNSCSAILNADGETRYIKNECPSQA